MRLILASTSPRRREILSLLGLPFDVIAPVFEEVSSPHLDVREEVLQFAAGKARSVLRNNPQSIVIGGDTMISLGGKKIGKPVDLADAKQMLRALSGRIHRIFTSVAIMEDFEDFAGRDLNLVAEVTVKMRDLTDAIIEEYLAYNESMDKAGAYSIQSRGSELVDFIEGDYLAAVGLPLKPVAEYFKGRGVTVPLDVDKLYRDKSYLNWCRVSCDP